MFWLDFNLSLSDEFEVEKQARYIQASTDIDELRTIATELLRFATVQAHVSNQLVTQVAEIEAGMGCPVTAEHEAWAALSPPSTRHGLPCHRRARGMGC